MIIAEAGVNHNGDFDKAKALIEHAAKAGVDYIKFQTYITEKLVSPDAKKAVYQQNNTTERDNSQYSMLKKLELSHDWHFKLKEIAEKNGISFLSTGFDEESVDFLDSIGMDFFKIPSGEITNKPYLQHIARKNKKVIMSSGMATINEISQAINIFETEGLSRDNITILHCNTEYPTPMQDVNLLAMLHIKQELGVEVGYSDHTLGIEIPIAAVTLGAKVIEKHFTLDRNLPGPDHKASLEPDELKKMVNSIRNIELAISGTGFKSPSVSELKNINVARKSLHFSSKIQKGNIVTFDDISVKRPGNGISPMEIDEFIGKKLKYDVCENQLIKVEDFE